MKWESKLKLKDSKIKNFIDFLFLAKQVEKVSVNADYWSYDPVAVKTFEDVGTVKAIENNYKNTEIILNPPAFNTSKSGSYLNDYQSCADRVALNLLNQDREAIKQVKVNDRIIENSLSSKSKIYKYEGSLSFIDGFSIKIETKENDKILEVRGIDMLVNIAGD